MQTIELFFTNIRRVFSLIVGLISFIIGTIADEGADIVIRGLPLATPMPNAISVFWVSQTSLNFSWWQALAFAATIEFALFGLFEVTLIMFDGYQERPDRYKWPLIIAVGVSMLVLVLIVIIVYEIEDAHSVLASLPLLSAAGATALALKRWHVRNSTAVEKSQEITLTQYRQNTDNLVEESGNIAVISENAIDPIERMRAGRMRKIAMRHDAILQYLSDEELSVGDLAERVGCSKKTIQNDLDALQSAGHSMSVNGVVKLQN